MLSQRRETEKKIPEEYFNDPSNITLLKLWRNVQFVGDILP